MVSFRLKITFVSLFIFLHLIFVQSSAHTVHGAMSKVLAADETVQPRRRPINVRKEIYDRVPAAVTEVEETRFGGRKMAPKRIMGMVKEEVFFSTNGERFIRRKSSHPSHVKVEIAGFIPFNADYHVPKPHPPKNN